MMDDGGNDRDNWKIVGFPMGQKAHYYNYCFGTGGSKQRFSGIPGTDESLLIGFEELTG